MVSSGTDMESNLFLTAMVYWEDRDLSELTNCQSISLIGLVGGRFDTLRLRPTVAETIRWSEPAVAKVEKAWESLTLLDHFF